MLNVTHTFKFDTQDKLNQFIEHVQDNFKDKVISFNHQLMPAFGEYILTLELTEDIPLKDLIHQPSDAVKHWQDVQYTEPPFHYNNVEKTSTFWNKHPKYKNTFYVGNAYIKQYEKNNRLAKYSSATGVYIGLPHPLKSMEDTPLRNTDFAVRQTDKDNPEKIKSWLYVCHSTGVKCIIYNTIEFPGIDWD